MKSLKSKFELALVQVNNLTEKKRLLGAEILEHVLTAQRYHKNKQDHHHKMQKIEANVAAKECLAVLQLDCNQLKKAK